MKIQHIPSVLISDIKKDTTKVIATLLIDTDIKGLNKISVKDSMETKRRKNSPGKAGHFPQAVETLNQQGLGESPCGMIKWI